MPSVACWGHRERPGSRVPKAVVGRGEQHLTQPLAAPLNLVLTNLRHSLRYHLLGKGSRIQMFDNTKMDKYITVYWNVQHWTT